MQIVLEESESTIIRLIDAAWESGLCSAKYTNTVYNKVLNIIMTSFEFTPSPMMADIKTTLDRPKMTKKSSRKHTKEQIKRQLAAIELIKRRSG